MSFNEMRITARCLAGNGLGAAPLHYFDAVGCIRASRGVADAAGLTSLAGLAGHRELHDTEAAYLAAARDGHIPTMTFSPARWIKTTFGLTIRALWRLATRPEEADREALAIETA